MNALDIFTMYYYAQILATLFVLGFYLLSKR